jgi:AraC family transcriptional regulator
LDFLAKIAVETVPETPSRLRDTERKSPDTYALAAGPGWTIHEVVCTAGPDQPVFEEQHVQTSIAVVVNGTFEYRTSTGRELMAPGSLLLGNAGESFACGHQHGVGDRCISFHYSDELRDGFQQREERRCFKIPRIPPIRSLSRLVADVSMLRRGDVDRAMFQEIAFRVFEQAACLQHGFAGRQRASDPSSFARVTRVLRSIEAAPETPHELSEMAAMARLSPYHFLRCFDELTGTTPRQYLLRMRLRRAAIRLKEESTKVLDIALDCGFRDVSNFNRAFRNEFGESPRSYRATACLKI